MERATMICATSAQEQARLWLDNKRIVDEWISDYGRRSGLSRDEIVADRKLHWCHDERAEVVGTFGGYELSACPLEDGKWRYTVVTPWEMSEGLCDTSVRDDEQAKTRLKEVSEAVLALMGGPEPPKVTKRQPKDTKSADRTHVCATAARSVVKKAQRRPQSVPNRTFATHKVNGMPQLALF